MKEYTDLELNMLIAELECYKVVAHEGYQCCAMNAEDIITHIPYSPLSGATRTLLFNLMVKYKVEISYEFNTCGFSKASMSKFDTEFKSKSEIPRAIIMCILKSKKII